MNNLLNVKIVFGSWKAYNESNDRALGSKWLDMSDYDSVEEIYEELKKEGFTDQELEETFIQDYEADIQIFENCDNINIEEAFELLESIDGCDVDIDTLKAYIEIEGVDSAIQRLKDDDFSDVTLWKDMSLEDVAYEIVQESYATEDNEFLLRYFDYEAYARDLSFDGYHETTYGVIEIH